MKKDKKFLCQSVRVIFITLKERNNTKRKKKILNNHSKQRQNKKKGKITFLDTTFNYQIVLQHFQKNNYL